MIKAGSTSTVTFDRPAMARFEKEYARMVGRRAVLAYRARVLRALRKLDEKESAGKGDYEVDCLLSGISMATDAVMAVPTRRK